MVAFQDRSLIAQLGTPDMKVPIQYAFSYPHRIESEGEKLSLAQIGSCILRRWISYVTHV